VLLLIVSILYLLAALGLAGVPVLSHFWQVSIALASAFSLALIILFWHPWFVIGALLDVALFAFVYFRIPSVLYN